MAKQASNEKDRTAGAGYLLGALCLAALLWAGFSTPMWTTDDAYISFRYASNLVEGHGLVFNQGERVEGYTNFLWTLWTAAGLALDVTAENWSRVWGLASYLGAILLLFLNHWLLRQRCGLALWLIPLGALGAVLVEDWGIFATSGLETALFTLLLLAGYLLVAWYPLKISALIFSGVLFALASLTRPDGILPAGVVGICVILTAERRLLRGISFGLSFAAIWLPFIAWRIWYYGDFFPNTYYAKSAGSGWYAQGWHYTLLFFERYWVLLLGPVLLIAASLLRRRPKSIEKLLQRQTLLALSIVAVYLFYVIRVGGDFMFARFLIPVVPFLLIALEFSWIRVFEGRLAHGLAVAAVVFAGLALTPPPVTGTEWSRGVANEWMYYSPRLTNKLDHMAEVLERYFAGLPVRVAFFGDDARIVYKAKFPLAIESHAGLTDPQIAKQELTERGRVGHEKHATAEYLIDERKAHFTFSRVPQKLLELDRYIPEISVRFDEDVYGRVLHWDPELLGVLQQRGALIQNFPALLDIYIQRLEQLERQRVAADFERFKRFYFNHVDDPAREAVFLSYLGAGD